jgi:Ca-activated chloride channel family protein
MSLDAGSLAGRLPEGELVASCRTGDALAFALHYFSGIRGKRAMVLLSDGVDSKSDFAFADVLEYAQRTGVAIYAIGMNVPSNPPDAGICLDQLARKTGGRSYRIERAVELGPIYKTIERELRAQYLISYQSSNPEREGFRPIELEVRRPGAKVATVAGYYP